MTKPKVKAGQIWQHYNGIKYRVLLLTNTKSNNPKYEVTVVYENVEIETKWSRPLDDWHRSMTLIEDV